MARNIQSLERAAAMLRLLAGGERRLGLSDIASSLGLAKGTAHGILRTLQHEGFVEQDDASGRYQLGAELLRLGTTYLDVHELRARALVWTDDLARSSGESVHLGVLHQRGVLIVHHVFRPDDSRQVLEIGAMQPLHSTALGKVLSAYDPVAHSEALEADRKAFTDRTVCDLDAFEHILDLTRARGTRRTWRRPGRAWPPSPPPSTTGAVCRWARWASRGRWSGCAGTASCALSSSRRYGTAPARCRGIWAPDASERVTNETGAPHGVPVAGMSRGGRSGAGPWAEIDNPERSITIAFSITKPLTGAGHRERLPSIGRHCRTPTGNTR
ncbi:hypothetical protein SHKM778_65110 [Streptomyces sp. KM77-8]|uniref:Glycerol operon regulatory protein n=1 Tax=Streptomyces haneummycinicus TaxID=3074435 RepID=A0AAT9HSG3_9ACTN